MLGLAELLYLPLNYFMQKKQTYIPFKSVFSRPWAVVYPSLTNMHSSTSVITAQETSRTMTPKPSPGFISKT